VVTTKHVLVANVFVNVPLNIRFNRTLTEDRWDSWVSLLRKLMNVHLTDEPDSFNWNLTTTGIFSIKSMYADCLNGHTVFLKKILVEHKDTTQN
jgi:hypothetical protein